MDIRFIGSETYNAALWQVETHTVAGSPVFAYAQHPGQVVRVPAGCLETQVIGV